MQQQTEQFRRPERRISWGGRETPLANLEKYQLKKSEDEFTDADSDDVHIKRLSSRSSHRDDKKYDLKGNNRRQGSGQEKSNL